MDRGRSKVQTCSHSITPSRHNLFQVVPLHVTYVHPERRFHCTCCFKYKCIRACSWNVFVCVCVFFHRTCAYNGKASHRDGPNPRLYFLYSMLLHYILCCIPFDCIILKCMLYLVAYYPLCYNHIVLYDSVSNNILYIA